MPQTHGQMSIFLEEKLNKVVNESESLKPLAKMINILFSVQSSQEAFVQFLGMTDLGALVPFDGQYEEGNVYPGYKSRIVFPEFGLKVVDEKKLQEDIGFKNVLANAKSLVAASDETKEDYAGRFWGNMDSVNTDFGTTDEGLPVASNSHTSTDPNVNPAVLGGYDNLGVNAFSYSGLHEALWNMRQYRKSNGKRINRPDAQVYGIVHPDWMTWQVEQVIGTEKGLDGGGDLNVNPAHKGLRGNTRFKSIPYSRLDEYSVNTWGLVDLTMLMENFFFYNRIKGTYSNHVDRETENIIQTYRTRFGIGYQVEGWRAINWNVVPD